MIAAKLDFLLKTVDAPIKPLTNIFGRMTMTIKEFIKHYVQQRVKKNIFEKILAYETDPLTAIIAVNELKNTDAEFQKLSNRVAKFIKNYNLSI